MADRAPTLKSVTESPNTKRENLTQGTVQVFSQRTQVFSESVPQNLLRVPYIPERFSLLTVTPLDTWLASSCTRVTIWSPLPLERHLYSSSYSTKLPMRGVTRCIASLERDPLSGEYGVSPCTPSLWYRLPLLRSASLAHHACSGKLFPCPDFWLGNDHLITSSFVLVPLENLKQAFLIFRRCAPLGDL